MRPFPEAGVSLQQVSTNGGRDTGPLWAHSGRELFYVNGVNDVWTKRSEVSTDPAFALGQQEVLFSDSMVTYESHSGCGRYIRRAPPDDQRFVMLRIGDRENAVASELIRSGPNEVFVRPFPEAGVSLQQVSTNGGREPVWLATVPSGSCST